MKTYFLSIIFSLISIQAFSQLRNQFSKQEVLDDVTYLYTSLKDTHYDIYTYTTEEKFATNYQAIKNTITKDSLSLLEVTSIFQRVITVVNNGHTEIEFPIQSYKAYAMNGGTLFPLEIVFENDTPLIRKNWSTNREIPMDSEILSINGLSIQEILAKIYPQVSAERLYFKHAKIEVYSFPRYYWQVFGQQDVFEIEVATKNGTEKYTLKAINLINDYEMKRTDVLNAKMELQLFRRAAYLNPGNFSGDEEKYKAFIDTAFQQINNENVSNLIIDLRNNGGGNDSFSDYLVSYIADKPFQWTSKYEVKSSQLLKDHIRKSSYANTELSKEILAHTNGDVFTHNFKEYQPQSKEKRFKGDVFVLVNRQSHSQATVTAAQIQDYNFGIIIGEETGEYSSLCASQFTYTLPKTGIEVKVSKGFMTRLNGKVEQKGVQPDVVINNHLLTENDEVLAEVLSMIIQLGR